MSIFVDEVLQAQISRWLTSFDPFPKIVDPGMIFVERQQRAKREIARLFWRVAEHFGECAVSERWGAAV